MTFTKLNELNINSLNEVISLTVGLAGEISNGITVLNGIANNTPVVSLTATDKALRKSAGCNSDYLYNEVTDKVKYYSHAPIELPIEICLQSLWGKMVARGINLEDDFSATDLAGFIQSEVLKVLEADLLRLAWLDGDVKPEATGYNIFTHGGIIQQFKRSKASEHALTLNTTGVLTALRGAIDAQRPDTLDTSEFFVTSNVMRLYKNILQDKDNSLESKLNTKLIKVSDKTMDISATYWSSTERNNKNMYIVTYSKTAGSAGTGGVKTNTYTYRFFLGF